jgi:hypothetical protein
MLYCLKKLLPGATWAYMIAMIEVLVSTTSDVFFANKLSITKSGSHFIALANPRAHLTNRNRKDLSNKKDLA